MDEQAAEEQHNTGDAVVGKSKLLFQMFTIFEHDMQWNFSLYFHCSSSKYVLCFVIGDKKSGGRGPTEMRKFWQKHGPNNKVNLEFNHLGQPCGLKTSKLTNFIGTCVKGKEVSVAYVN